MKALVGEPKGKKASVIESEKQLVVGAPQLRTLEAMQYDMRRRAPLFPSENGNQLERNGTKSLVQRLRRRQASNHFLPTIDQSKYQGYKAKAQEKATSAKRKTGSAKSSSAVATEELLAPGVFVGPDIEGATNVDGVFPPDTHGAVGLFEFVEVTNEHIDIFDKNNPANRTSISHAAFFGYQTQALFDARAVYDNTWNRWIITAEAFQESDTVQYHFIAISTTPSALDPFFIYQINVTFFQGDFWDFPQLGMDQDSIIVTANIFPAFTADMFAVAKARLYNGLGFSVPVFTNLISTLAPPIVLDQNPETFLIAAESSGNGTALQVYTLTNSSHPAVISLIGPVAMPVAAYNVPAAAQQPDTPATLDTLDSRFVNASTQIGGSLWQVHTIDAGGLPTPRFYEIDTTTKTVRQSGFFYASLSSFDFNASVAANSDNDVFFTWTSTDPNNKINAQVRFAGCDHNDGAANPGAGEALFTSPTFFLGGRWGDYSAVTIDPLNSRKAWIVNEDIMPNGDWGSRIGGIGLP